MITCKECGSWKVENAELKLCSKCNCAKRKAERIENRSPKKGKLDKKKIATFSNRNTYKTSTGERFTKAQIETKVKAAKLLKKAQFLKEHGYIFCEDCKSNQPPFDTSHELSVDECQKQGTAEYAWNVNFLKFRCRKCHQIKDKNCVGYMLKRSV